MKTILSVFLLLLITASLFGQEEDNSSDKINTFSSTVTIQNKGISTIPNLTLGEPAILLNMKMGGKLSFEPEFRVSLETGKPWALVLWTRYYGAVSEKFKITYHANYSLSFKTIDLFNADGSDYAVTRTNRYLVGAMSPSYQINKYIGIGAYLFYARGLDPYMIENTYLASIQPTISNIPLFKNTVARIRPEVYFLKMGKEGVFFSTRFYFTNPNSPFSITGVLSNPIKSDIPSDYGFLWNVGVSYTFNKKYKDAN